MKYLIYVDDLINNLNIMALNKMILYKNDEYIVDDIYNVFLVLH